MENFLNLAKDEQAPNGRSLKDPWEFEQTFENITFEPEVLLSSIMIKGAQMEPLFSDPRFFYRMNAQWWNKWKYTFYKWLVVMDKDYEPLWNKNAWEETHEDTVDVGTNDTVTSHTEVMDDDTSYSKTGAETEVMDDDTTYQKSGDSKEIIDDDTTNHSFTENKVSAFDSSSYSPHDTSEVDGSGTDDRTTTTEWSEEGSGTDDKTTTKNWSESGTGTDDRTTTFNGTVDNDTTGDRDFDRASHQWGNIGVTTTQKMFEDELKIRYFNIYEHMSDIFLDEMAVRVF